MFWLAQRPLDYQGGLCLMKLVQIKHSAYLCWDTNPQSTPSEQALSVQVDSSHEKK
jgi:hypothetical protein